jgi:hypothetical protein
MQKLKIMSFVMSSHSSVKDNCKREYSVNITNVYLFFEEGGGARLSPSGTSASVWPSVLSPVDDDDDDDCGAVCGMRIGRGN